MENYEKLIAEIDEVVKQITTRYCTGLFAI